MPDDVVIEADLAERVLNDPTFQKMLAKSEAAITEAWKKAESAEQRELLHAQLTVLRGLVHEFEKTIDAGRFEKARRNQFGPTKRSA